MINDFQLSWVDNGKTRELNVLFFNKQHKSVTLVDKVKIVSLFKNSVMVTNNKKLQGVLKSKINTTLIKECDVEKVIFDFVSENLKDFK